MADLSKLSDDELQKMLAAKRQQALQSMSDEDLEKLRTNAIAKKTETVRAEEDSGILGTVAKAARTYDSYTGAPVRAAIGAVQEGQGLMGAVRRAQETFGADTEQDTGSVKRAPTGKEIAERAGLSKDRTLFSLPLIGDVSPAGLAGLAVDVAADPTNLIPVGAVVRGAGAAVKGAGSVALKGAEKVVAPLRELAAVKGTEKVLKGSKTVLEKYINPKQAENWPELKAIAEKNGIDPSLLPESVEMGQSSINSRLARQIRSEPVGQDLLEKFEAGQDAVREAAGKKVAAIGKGTVLDPVQAGEFIRDSYDAAYREFFNQIDVSYDKIIKDYPGLKIAEAAQKDLDAALNGIEKFAKGRIERGVTSEFRAQGEGLINSVNAIRNGNGSVKQTVEALRDIGEAAFTSKNSLASIPPDTRKLRDLYGRITDALHETIKTDVKDGQEISQALRAANAKMTEWFGEKSVVADVIGNKQIGSEKVFNSLVLGGDTRRIQALAFIIGPERMQVVKAAALGDLMQKSVGKNGLEFGTLRSAMKNKRNVLGELLDPAEAQEFGELVNLGESFGNAVLSSSETGASLGFKDLAKSIPRNVAQRSALENLNSKARAVREAPTIGPPAAEPTPLLRSILERSRGDNYLKAVQVTGAQDASRRIEDDKKRKGK
jgi:hypothetical protein